MTQPVTWAELMKNAQGQLEPVPDGDYDVKVVASEATKSSTDKLMFKVKFEITSGPHIKRRVFTQFVVSDDSPMALAIFFRHMKALGLDDQFFGANPNPDQVASAMMNRICRVTLGHRTWQGVERNEVKGVQPPLGGGPMAPGVTTGPAGVLPSPGATPALPTPSTPAATPTPTTPTVGNGPTVGQGPTAPSGPPPLPI